MNLSHLRAGIIGTGFIGPVHLEALKRLGVQVNAGHGINYTNIALIRTVPHLAELNIGHSIVARAVFSGLDAAVREMLAAMKI